VIGLGAGAVLVALGLLTRKEVNTIEWTVLILMWGGLTLGEAMSATGLVEVVANLPLQQLAGLVVALVLVALGLGISTFMSNTATAALLLPIAIAFALPNRGQLVVLTALACSFAMALPVSTPPNALAFATGRLHSTRLLQVGVIVGLVAMGVMLAGYRVMVPLALP
jgi:sodium-dependent dicarboxylate transporter 2/3/5